jgi:hypothetical protein
MFFSIECQSLAYSLCTVVEQDLSVDRFCYSMTDVTRLLENPVEATTIEQNFLLLLVKHVKKDIRNNIN